MRRSAADGAPAAVGSDRAVGDQERARQRTGLALAVVMTGVLPLRHLLRRVQAPLAARRVVAHAQPADRLPRPAAPGPGRRCRSQRRAPRGGGPRLLRQPDGCAGHDPPRPRRAGGVASRRPHPGCDLPGAGDRRGPPRRGGGHRGPRLPRGARRGARAGRQASLARQEGQDVPPARLGAADREATRPAHPDGLQRRGRGHRRRPRLHLEVGGAALARPTRGATPPAFSDRSPRSIGGDRQARARPAAPETGHERSDPTSGWGTSHCECLRRRGRRARNKQGAGAKKRHEAAIGRSHEAIEKRWL